MSLPSDMKYAEELVLTYQKRGNALLGYMKLYEPNRKGFDDQLQKMKKWSRGRGGDHRTVQRDNPETISNEPQTGIEIVEHVSRTSKLSNNKVWRVKDPRGFQMEISSANFDELMNHTDVIDRTFQIPLIWLQRSKGGGSMWLVPAGSEIHQKAIERHEIRNKRVSLRDVNRGDTVQLQDGRIVQYLGGLYHYGSPRPLSQQGELKDPTRAYFYVLKEGQVPHTSSTDDPGELGKKNSLKVSQIVERADEPMTKTEVEKLAHDKIEQDKIRGDNYSIQYMPFAKATKFTKEDVEVKSGKCYIDGEEHKIRQKDGPRVWKDGQRVKLTFD